jgi:hypothetical protein
MSYAMGCGSGTCTRHPRLNGAGVFPGKLVLLRRLRGLGDDSLIDDETDFFVDPSIIGGSELPTTFAPIGAGSLDTISAYTNNTLTPPSDVLLDVDNPNFAPLSPAALAAGAVGTNSSGQLVNANGAVISNPPTGAVGVNSSGQYVNSAGQVVGALGTAAGAAGQIYSAAQIGRPALTAAMIAAGAVGYNALGQPVNALGQVISTPLIPGISNTTLMYAGIALVIGAVVLGASRK